MLAKPTKDHTGYVATLICDNQCHQAWGKTLRPTFTLGSTVFWIADGTQPVEDKNPSPLDCKILGGHSKPGGSDVYKLNRWCQHECERSRVVRPGERFSLPNFEFPVEVVK